MAHSESIKKSNRAYQRIRRYGLHPEEYDKLFRKQDGKCAICRMPAGTGPKERLHADHDHETNVVRGLLCWTCNRMIDHLNWFANYIDDAKMYLFHAAQAPIIADWRNRREKLKALQG